MVGQLIQNLVWIFPNGSTANTKSCLDTSKWWINGPSKTIWMDLNDSTACYQHCSNGITMCVQNQCAFLKVEISNGLSVWGLIHLLMQASIWSLDPPSSRHHLSSPEPIMYKVRISPPLHSISKCVSPGFTLWIISIGEASLFQFSPGLTLNTSPLFHHIGHLHSSSFTITSIKISDRTARNTLGTRLEIGGKRVQTWQRLRKWNAPKDTVCKVVRGARC